MSLAGLSNDPIRNQNFSPDKYTVGWICAIPVELRTARCFFDAEHSSLSSRPKHDENSYNLGTICGHNVVMICLPELGGVKAAVAAKSIQVTFPNVRFWLMVGIDGGIPNPPEVDIRLGDVVVSITTDQGPGVIQYDLGRIESDDFHGIFDDGISRGDVAIENSWILINALSARDCILLYPPLFTVAGRTNFG